MNLQRQAVPWLDARWVCACLLIFSVASVDGVEAQEAHALHPVASALEVQSDDPCLREDLGPEVAQWLHRDEVDASLTAVLRVPASGTGLLLEIVHDGVVFAERPFEDDDASCEERRAALALMIALALDTAELEVEAAPAVDEPSGWRGGLVISGSGSIDVLPAPAGGLALTGEVGFELLTLRLGAFGALSTDVPLGTGSISTALLMGSLEACLGDRWDAFGLEGCVGAGAGAVSARGHGYSVDESTWIAWASVLGSIAARFHIDELNAVRLAAELLVPFVRPEIVIAGPMGAPVTSLGLPAAGGSVSLGWCFSFR